jgi:hypothetical protein
MQDVWQAANFTKIGPEHAPLVFLGEKKTEMIAIDAHFNVQGLSV